MTYDELAEQDRETLLAAAGREAAEILRLRRDPENRDRWLLTTGNKTDLGLARTLIQMAEDIKAGRPLL